MIRRWREVERWIEDEAESSRTSGFPLLLLREVLDERKDPVRVQGAFDGWQAITIKFSGDVIPRDRATAFKGAMFAAYPGDLVFSKIDARNGAVGLIPDSIGKAVVTSEYPVFVPKEDKLRPAYLHHLLRADYFKADLKRKASGTSGRKRVTPEGFLSLRVPVPSLDEQDKMISTYLDALNRAAKLEIEAEAAKRSAWKTFELSLGLTAPSPMPDRPLFVTQFKDIERWSHEGILRAAIEAPASQSPWPLIPLGQAGKVSYGIQKCPANRPTVHARPYLRVANVQRGVLDLREIKFINVPDEEMPKLKLEVGDVLLCEGNSPDLVGRGAIWQGEIENCVHQNHVLRVRLDQGRLLPEFVLAIINSCHGQAYFRSKAKRTTNLASINSKEVAGLPVPMPSIAEQRSLLVKLDGCIEEANRKQAEAVALRHSAWSAFESALFETKA